MAIKPELDKPTRRSVERLFKEILQSPWEMYSGELRRLREKREAMEKGLLSHPTYKKLVAKQEAAETKYYNDRRALEAAVRQVRLEYLAKGLTPDVLKQIEDLVKLANKEQ